MLVSSKSLACNIGIAFLLILFAAFGLAATAQADSSCGAQTWSSNATMQVTTGCVSAASINPGQSETVSATFTPAENLTNAVIALTVLGPSTYYNAPTLTRTLVNGQPVSVSGSVTIPIDATLGSYHLRVTVFSAGNATRVFDGDVAATFALSAAQTSPPPMGSICGAQTWSSNATMQVTTGCISADSINPGQSETLSATFTPAENLTNAVIALSVLGPSTYYNAPTITQSLITGQAVSVSGLVAIPTDAPLGSYHLRVTVFSAGNATRVFDGDIAAIFTLTTTTPSAVNGACGSANGTTVTTRPTANFCSAGTASVVSGAGPWAWTCAGSSGGTDASCSAALQSTSGFPTTRDPLKWPFSQNSIWNMPIGTGAAYVAANINASPTYMDGNDPHWNDDPNHVGAKESDWQAIPFSDEEIMMLHPEAAPISVYPMDGTNGGFGLPPHGRCTRTSDTAFGQLPWLASYYVDDSGGNDITTVLLASGKIKQMSPANRCPTQGYITALGTYNSFAEQDIKLDTGQYGAHGASSLSGFGGSLRIGELTHAGGAPRHALKINLGVNEMHNCTTDLICKRWPAYLADPSSWLVPGSEINAYGVHDTLPAADGSLKPGSLLAIPATVNINALGLESEPGLQLAWTLQNYGAYMCDTTGNEWGGGVAFSTEVGPEGKFTDQFYAEWGMGFTEFVKDRPNSPWARDVAKILAALYVVDNNSETAVGGGGTPLQPLAPPFQ